MARGAESHAEFRSSARAAGPGVWLPCSAKACIKHVLRYNLHFFHAFPVKKEGLFERNASVLFKSVMVVMLALYRSFVLEADLAAVEELTEVQT